MVAARGNIPENVTGIGPAVEDCGPRRLCGTVTWFRRAPGSATRRTYLVRQPRPLKHPLLANSLHLPVSPRQHHRRSHSPPQPLLPPSQARSETPAPPAALRPGRFRARCLPRCHPARPPCRQHATAAWHPAAHGSWRAAVHPRRTPRPRCSSAAAGLLPRLRRPPR